MPAQIPAGQPSSVREKSIHASLGLWRIKDELCFSVFLQHGVVMIYRHRAVSVAIGGGANTKNDVVQTIRKNRGADYDKNRGEQDSSQPRPEAERRCVNHDAKIIRPASRRAARRLCHDRPASQRPALASDWRRITLRKRSVPLNCTIASVAPSVWRSLTTRPSDRQTTAFAGNRFWRMPAAGLWPFRPYNHTSLRPWP
jgi:hypothetical protein